MIRRVFSKQTYNGYHIVNLCGDGEDLSPIGFFKKAKEKDELGLLVDPFDIPTCPHSGEVNAMGRPWGEFIIVPSLCQKCIWVYTTSNSEYDCLLKTKKKINPRAFVNGGAQ